MIPPGAFSLFVDNVKVQNFVRKSMTFSGGEVLIQITSDTQNLKNAKDIALIARVQSSDDLMSLVSVKDALDRASNNKPVRLIMPYIPYARQDRVCNDGEAFSLKCFAKILNSLHFSSVTVADPHSGVSEALIDNVKVLRQVDIVNSFSDLVKYAAGQDIVLVSPDAGANKKTAEIAKHLTCGAYVRCDKSRNLATGEINETIVHADDLSGKTCLIVDDICDGGRTFTAIAAALRKKNASQVHLYVTHGIFSASIEYLTNSGIDFIWTTNTFDFRRDPLKNSNLNRVCVHNLDWLLLRVN